MAIKNIFFICGALRSGSTLLHLMLNHHPNIKNPGEFDFMFDMVKDDGGFPSPHNYYEFLDKNRIFKSKNLTIDASLSFPKLIESFVNQLSEHEQMLTLNVHRNFHRIPYLFPDAKYIHLLRDPRDVARSSIEMGWRGNVYFSVDHWIDTELSWNKLAKLVHTKQYTTVYYEKLIENPEAELNNLCAFIEVPYDVCMLDYPLHSSYKKPDKTLAQQWKHKLCKREIQYVEAKASELIKLRDFTMSGHPSIQPSLMEKIKLTLQNKLFRANFGLTRYGTAIYLGEKLTRLLCLEKLNKKYLLIKNQIDQQHLK